MYKKLIQAGALAAMVGLPAAATAAEGDAEVVARVNGEPITRAEVQAMVQQGSGGRNVSLNPSQRAQVVERLVEVSLLAQEAQDKGLADDPSVKAQLDTTRRLILARSLVQDVSQDSEAITEEQVRAAYDEQYGNKGGNTELKARHILVEEEGKAEDLIAQLDEGADFAKLAEENSVGPTKKRGGDLGWFKADEMVGVFSQAAMELDEGEYTAEPVQTKYGWHVIKLEGKRSTEPPAFEDKRSELRQQIANDRIAERIDELRGKADVQISEGWGKARSSKPQTEAGGNGGSGDGMSK